MGKLGLLIILSLFILTCKTTDSEGEDLTDFSTSPAAGEEQKEENSTSETIRTEQDSDNEIAKDWLKEAEIAWFERRDKELTQYCLDQIEKADIVDEGDISLYELLCRKVYTRKLTWDNTLLDHRDISRLFIDNDDLWIGTWGGGIGRFSLPLNELTLFREAEESLTVETIYSFLKQGHMIRMAGYGYIYDYDKRNSLFNKIFPKGPERINGLELYKEQLYLSTVNKGVWLEQGNGEWHELSIPGVSSLINFLFKDSKNQLLVGTADRGILIYDGHKINNFNTLYPEFHGKNVTSISETGDFLMVGTYGEGAYLINDKTKKVTYLSEKEGTLSSDYVLCTSHSKTHAYWGTLGGGITACSLSDNSKIYFLGLEEGLLSLDVSSLVLYENLIMAANLEQGIIIIEEEIIEKKL